MKALVKIDRFVYILIGVLIALSVFVIIVFRGIFSAVLLAYGPSNKDNMQKMRVNKEGLKDALEYVRNKEVVNLETVD